MILLNLLDGYGVKSPSHEDIARCMRETLIIGKPVNGVDQRLRLYKETWTMFCEQKREIPTEMNKWFIEELVCSREFCAIAGINYDTAPNKMLDIVAGIAYFFRQQIDPIQEEPYISYAIRSYSTTKIEGKLNQISH